MKITLKPNRNVVLITRGRRVYLATGKRIFFTATTFAMQMQRAVTENSSIFCRKIANYLLTFENADAIEIDCYKLRLKNNSVSLFWLKVMCE